MKISELAKQAGVSTQTVRYYERIDLIPPPSRLASGYRNYDEKALQRLQFIRETKETGFTLNEIRKILSLDRSSSSSCREMQELLNTRLTLIDEKIKAMKRLKHNLNQVKKICEGSEVDSPCPLLEMMNAQ